VVARRIGLASEWWWDAKSDNGKRRGRKTSARLIYVTSGGQRSGVSIVTRRAGLSTRFWAWLFYKNQFSPYHIPQSEFPNRRSMTIFRPTAVSMLPEPRVFFLRLALSSEGSIRHIDAAEKNTSIRTLSWHWHNSATCCGKLAKVRVVLQQKLRRSGWRHPRIKATVTCVLSLRCTDNCRGRVSCRAASLSG
jgi:hypothetical protein